MRTFTVKEIIDATGGILLSGDESNEVYRVCTDSRKAGPGDLFLHLKEKTTMATTIWLRYWNRDAGQ